MMRAGLVAMFVVGACGVGNDPPTQKDPKGRLCTTPLMVSGTFTQGEAPPANPDGTAYVGCWPIGTWKFSATTAGGGCSPAPTLLPMYSFQGTRVQDPDSMEMVPKYTYLTDPSARAVMKVSEAAYAACDGELDIYSADGTAVFTFKPWLDPNGTIEGQGDYSVWSSDQWGNWN